MELYVFKTPDNLLEFNHGLFHGISGAVAYASAMFGADLWLRMENTGWRVSKVRLETPYPGHNGDILHVARTQEGDIRFSLGVFKNEVPLKEIMERTFTKSEIVKRKVYASTILASEVQSEAPIRISESVKNGTT